MSMENSRKVFSQIRRIRGKYLSTHEKRMKLGSLQYTKSSPNTQKVFILIRRIRRKYLIKYEENAKRILPHSPDIGVKFAQSANQ
jgi:hypothetical protein